VAATVAWRTRNAVVTMTLGMVTLWVAQWLR
jgi:branched-subunit amino acid transport protein